MDFADWSAVRDVFERALDLPPEARARFVDGETHGRDRVREQVLRLLERESQGDLLTPPESGAVLRSLEGWHPRPGDRIGGYSVVRLLGAGGMGTVYEARQEKPARAVAVKVMDAGLRYPEAARRFQIEGEVLGRLRHPGIAAIYEMGVHRSPDGGELPFFALEFVEGARDLVAYARERHLDVRARLALFCEVCAAVQHAHQKGVIHRDLKPGNILVDSAGRPKVIDYGVARVVAPDVAREALTRADHLLGTLQYMSPEQLGGAPDDLDTRADVYALGVVLYELLADRPPYDVAGRSIADVVDDVTNRTPPPPSQLAPALSRELDWIVLVALSKERERRYGSAGELAADLQRYLRREPVAAGPPTRRYRIAKFVARNRALVIAGAIVAVSLVAGLVATVFARTVAEERRIEAERARGEAEVRSAEAEAARVALAAEVERVRVHARRQTAVIAALSEIFDAVRPGEDGRGVTLYELLERRRPRLDAEFADDGALRAHLQAFLGAAYDALGLHSEGESLLAEAVATLEGAADADPRQLAWLRLMLANVRVRESRLDEARGLFEKSLPLLQGADEMRSGRGILALRLYAGLLAQSGATAEAAAALREVVEVSSQTLGADAFETLQATSQLAQALGGLRRWDDAERLARDAHRRSVAAAGADHPLALFTAMTLGEILHARGKSNEASDVLRPVLARSNSLYGESHRNAIHATEALASALARAGRPDEAEELANRALGIASREHPGDMDLEIRARMCVAGVLEARGDAERQREALVGALRCLEEKSVPDHPARFGLSWSLAELELATGRADAAATRAREMVARLLESPAGESRKIAVARGLLGRALWSQGKTEESRRELGECFAAVSAWSDVELASLSDDVLDTLIEMCALLGREDERRRFAALK